MQWAQKQKGFTIVELLIVVVVIAILAAITIVAYNGIQNRAKASAAQSTASQASKKLATYAVINSDSFPADKDSFLVATSLQEGNGISYQYSPTSDLKSYCLTTTSNGLSYSTSNTSLTPVAGGCRGHGINGDDPITNLVTNPSVEANTSGWGLAVNGSVSSRDTAAALVGSYGVKVDAPANRTDSGVYIPVSGSLTVGAVYTASFTLKAVTAGNYSLSVQGSAGTGSRDVKTLSAGQTARFTLTWTPSATGPFTFYALRQGSQEGTHTFYVDGVMLVKGNGDYAYTDGTSSNWVWNGPVNNSTSTGPAVAQ